MIDRYKEKLKQNWGAKAEAMDCFCEVKLIDPDSDWACYIYAMSPDEKEVCCILSGTFLQVGEHYLEELLNIYNRNGEHLVIDTEFRKIKASELLKKLKGEK